jgi:chemotaxis protein CheD
MSELMVRIGEIHASADPGDVLVALGLGSCIGLAVVDRLRGIAGLAHVMLPEAPAGGAAGERCADRAVPALLERVLGLGARRHRLEVALVGGAQMFASADSIAVGARNDAATRAALRRERLHISAAATGGYRGRTVRVAVGGHVVYREAGGELVTLIPTGGRA